jgi:hypothetical protein
LFPIEESDMRSSAFASALVGIAVLAGCSDSDPTSYRVSGVAQFNGSPIPYGEVVFTPDGSKQNSGPQGVAMIKDGRFDTGSGDGKGVAGGPTIVRVIGLTGPGGKPLCEHEYATDLPKGNSTLNIEVPATAVPKKAAGPEI